MVVLDKKSVRSKKRIKEVPKSITRMDELQQK
jgi:hypothetical protein